MEFVNVYSGRRLSEMPKIQKKRSLNRFWKCSLGICAYLFVILFLLFVTCFVIIPVVFKYSVNMQEHMVFPTYLIDKTANYTDFNRYGLKGVKNFYITVGGEDNVTLGAWEILPDYILSSVITNDRYNYDGLLKEIRIPILLYLHGNGNDRTAVREKVAVFRKYFLVIALDYRGYGDSTRAPLKKDALVEDVRVAYMWLRNQTQSKIFIWGHSLGTGVGAELVVRLNLVNKEVPSGLVLEAGFTNAIDVMERHPVIKAFSWLPWYKSTMINPLIDNGMNFDVVNNIPFINCPIMILHAKDDVIVPYDMAEKIYKVATTQRNTTIQGNATLHIFEAVGYDHMLIYQAPELPAYIKHFIEDAIKFEKRIGPLRNQGIHIE